MTTIETKENKMEENTLGEKSTETGRHSFPPPATEGYKAPTTPKKPRRPV